MSRPRHPEAARSQIRSLWGYQASMDAGKAGQTLKTRCSAQRPDVCRWLSPFILSCCVYFCLWIPEDQPSWVAALVKCLPILGLAGFPVGRVPGAGLQPAPPGSPLVLGSGGRLPHLAWSLPPWHGRLRHHPPSLRLGLRLLSPAAWPAAAHHPGLWPLPQPCAPAP
uniref:Uncharacterized protein n=1 Tax=Macaca fascicularis TaxID=9541 RepID=A0A7N9IC49_MACFA